MPFYHLFYVFQYQTCLIYRFNCTNRRVVIDKIQTSFRIRNKGGTSDSDNADSSNTGESANTGDGTAADQGTDDNAESGNTDSATAEGENTDGTADSAGTDEANSDTTDAADDNADATGDQTGGAESDSETSDNDQATTNEGESKFQETVLTYFYQRKKMAAQSQLFAYHSPLASPLLSTELALLYVSAPQKTCP